MGRGRARRNGSRPDRSRPVSTLAAAKLAVNRGLDAAGFRNALNAGLDVLAPLYAATTEVGRESQPCDCCAVALALTAPRAGPAVVRSRLPEGEGPP